jgi:hypothetical protein
MTTEPKLKYKVECDLEFITPDQAAIHLSNRWREQRNVRTNHVSKLVTDILEGRFRVSPDCIVILKGQLANGQHRLQAVVESRRGQWFLVMKSNDEELYKVIDSGLRRNVGDALIGLPYGRAFSSIARWVQAYWARLITQQTKDPHTAMLGRKTTRSMSQAAVIEYCEEHAAILGEAAAFTNHLYEQTRILPLSMGGALYVIGKTTGHEEKAQAFLRQVYVEGGSHSAANELRNRLTANRGAKAKLPAGYIFGITLKAFKSFCNGTRPSKLAWEKGEPFPEL